MIVIIRKAKSFLRLLRLRAEWGRAAVACRQQGTLTSALPPVTDDVLVLMPHSDDEWIGCSSLLKAGVAKTVMNMDMPGGDNEGTHSLRRREAERMAERYGYQLLPYSRDALQKWLEVSAATVAVPCFIDWHPEHHRVMDLFRDAADGAGFLGDVLMYQVSLPMPETLVNAAMPLSQNDLKEKWTLFYKIYKTQRFMPTKRFEAHERIDGALCGTYAAEVYSRMPYREWARALDAGRPSQSQRDAWTKAMNDVPAIRSAVNNYLEERRK